MRVWTTCSQPIRACPTFNIYFDITRSVFTRRRSICRKFQIILSSTQYLASTHPSNAEFMPVYPSITRGILSYTVIHHDLSRPYFQKSHHIPSQNRISKHIHAPHLRPAPAVKHQHAGIFGTRAAAGSLEPHLRRRQKRRRASDVCAGDGV